MTTQPKIVAWLKPQCGWSNGVRAIFKKYSLEYEDRDIINNAENYEEMVEKSGQQLSPCVEVDGHMLADVSGDEVETWMIEHKYISKSDEATDVPTGSACGDEEHERMRAAAASVNFKVD